MAKMVKVIEALAESGQSWEEAAATAVKEAAKTVRGIKPLCIENREAKVEGERIVQYRINGKLSLLLDP